MKIEGFQKEEFLREFERAMAEVVGVEDVRRMVEEGLRMDVEPLKILEAMRKGLDDVGRKYEEGEYFLMELILSGLMASEVAALLKPYLRAQTRQSMGKVVIGTVEGDLHDIGKNIVATMLSAGGFEVIDLGVDVTAEKFVEAVEKEKPDILAMSVLLSIGLPHMAEVIRRLEKVGLRNRIKIMVGGRPVTEEYARQIGADAYGSDAIEALRIAQEWMRGKDLERSGEDKKKDNDDVR
ncbi:corrinoid protein [Candidatus Bathyarchaeota archaeon]|nr:corrinoid protein [Candidatus Bathyarchaeota archaeon]